MCSDACSELRFSLRRSERSGATLRLAGSLTNLAQAGFHLPISSGKARYVTLFRDTAVKLAVKRIIVGPVDGADERSRALSRRLQ